jgi:hypothetical protein
VTRIIPVIEAKGVCGMTAPASALCAMNERASAAQPGGTLQSPVNCADRNPAGRVAMGSEGACC